MLKVSIIVPCYNQAQYLPEALQSVLDQTYENWECIIVNDGSPDNTEEVAKQWVEKDSRFKYFYKENGGLSSARNTGIAIAKGEFILPLDADDRISRDYALLAIEAFQDDSSLKLVYCKAEKFGVESGSWDLLDFSLFELARENVIFCSAFYRKIEWERVGGYDVNMIYGLEDWEFWISILKNGGGVKCLNHLGFYYRIKSSSMLKELNQERKNILHQYLSIKHVDFFIKNLGSSIELYNNLQESKKCFKRKMKSKKFVLDIFLKTFFGFTIFNSRNNLY